MEKPLQNICKLVYNQEQKQDSPDLQTECEWLGKASWRSGEKVSL